MGDSLAQPAMGFFWAACLALNHPQESSTALPIGQLLRCLIKHVALMLALWNWLQGALTEW